MVAEMRNKGSADSEAHLFRKFLQGHTDFSDSEKIQWNVPHEVVFCKQC